tara:strand:+ start:124 stop:696 length:573 start_codon:yes stop_codon:yes gene_type:complete
MGTTRYLVQTTATAGSSSRINQGDLVLALANGLVDIEDGAGTNVNNIIGVMAGCEYTNTSGEPVFDNAYPGTSSLKSGTVAYVHVYDNPMQIFEIQGDGTPSAGTGLANYESLVHAAGMGTGFGGAGVNGISTGEFDVSTGEEVTATTDVFRIIGIKNYENLTAEDRTAGAGIIYLVKINSHAYLQGDGI